MPGRIYDNSIHFIYPVVIFSTVGVFLFWSLFLKARNFTWWLRTLKIAWNFNHLTTKRRLLYLKTQSVPRSKNFSSRLQKSISLCCKWHKSLFVLRLIQNIIQCGQSLQLLNVKLVGTSHT
jgi:hypothetical protein